MQNFFLIFEEYTIFLPIFKTIFIKIFKLAQNKAIFKDQYSQYQPTNSKIIKHKVWVFQKFYFDGEFLAFMAAKMYLDHFIQFRL